MSSEKYDTLEGLLLNKKNIILSSGCRKNVCCCNWTLEQLNWKLYDAGNYEEWDGLTALFIELVNADKTLLEDSYIKKWYRLSC